MTPFDLKRLFPKASKSFLDANPRPELVRKRALDLIDNKNGVKWPLRAKKDASSNVQDHHIAPSSKPKRTSRHESMGQKEGKNGHPIRLLVSVTSFRRRLLDPDNLIPKYFVDCLRYCGILSGDTEAEVDLRISQKKVSSKAEERTEIEIDLIPS